MGHYANECDEDEETNMTSNKKVLHREQDSISEEEVDMTISHERRTGFVVHKVDSTCHVFMPSNKGLFFSDVEGDVVHILINTVDKNKNKNTIKQYYDAHKARQIQDIIGRPSTTYYIGYVERDLLLNCPVLKKDIIRAEDILGPNLDSLMGKTNCKTSEKVALNTLNNLPNGMLDDYGDVTIDIDIMYIN